MTEAGPYSARIIATIDSGDLGGLAGREFYLWNTVVVGDPVGPESGYTKVYEGKNLAQSSALRHYVNVPAGATAMRVRLEVSKDVGSSSGAMAMTEICDPEGRVRGSFAGYARTEGDNIKDSTVLKPELFPGIWEINVVGSITANDQTDYRLTVSFDGYDVEPSELTGFSREATGKNATGTAVVTRSFAGVFKGSAEATLDGFVKDSEVEIEKTEEWTKSFTLDSTTPEAAFHLVMDESVANLFTDCAVNILDESDKALRITAFDGLEAHAGISLPEDSDSATYTLQVVGAFAMAEDMAEWGFELEEKYLFGSSIVGSVKRAGGGRLDLFCGVPTDVKVSFDEEWPGAPEGMNVFGVLEFRDSNTDDRRPGDEGGRLVLEVPIKVD